MLEYYFFDARHVTIRKTINNIVEYAFLSHLRMI
jgi:hypothetical protein